MEEVNHFLPRVGMRCRCIMDNGQPMIYASSYTYHPDRIEFSETEEKEKSTVNYTIKKITDNKTRLTIDFYLQKNIAQQILFNLSQKRKWKRCLKSRYKIWKCWLRRLNFLQYKFNICLPAEVFIASSWSLH